MCPTLFYVRCDLVKNRICIFVGVDLLNDNTKVAMPWGNGRMHPTITCLVMWFDEKNRVCISVGVGCIQPLQMGNNVSMVLGRCRNIERQHKGGNAVG